MLTLTVVAAFFLGMWLLGPGAATKKGALSKMDNKEGCEANCHAIV